MGSTAENVRTGYYSKDPCTFVFKFETETFGPR